MKVFMFSIIHPQSSLIETSSRGGLVVERWSDHRRHSATVGSNLHQVWCINRSLEETLCHNSNCRMPGLQVHNTRLDAS